MGEYLRAEAAIRPRCALGKQLSSALIRRTSITIGRRSKIADLIDPDRNERRSERPDPDPSEDLLGSRLHVVLRGEVMHSDVIPKKPECQSHQAALDGHPVDDLATAPKDAPDFRERSALLAGKQVLKDAY
jgi:hypothetical protein